MIRDEVGFAKWQCPVCNTHRYAFQLKCTCGMHERTLEEAQEFNRLNNRDLLYGPSRIYMPKGTKVHFMGQDMYVDNQSDDTKGGAIFAAGFVLSALGVALLLNYIFS